MEMNPQAELSLCKGIFCSVILTPPKCFGEEEEIAGGSLNVPLLPPSAHAENIVILATKLPSTLGAPLPERASSLGQRLIRNSSCAATVAAPALT